MKSILEKLKQWWEEINRPRIIDGRWEKVGRGCWKRIPETSDEGTAILVTEDTFILTDRPCEFTRSNGFKEMSNRVIFLENVSSIKVIPSKYEPEDRTADKNQSNNNQSDSSETVLSFPFRVLDESIGTGDGFVAERIGVIREFPKEQNESACKQELGCIVVDTLQFNSQA